jgi:uncharacterized protein DUF3237
VQDLRTELLGELVGELDAPLDLGPTPSGARRIVHIRGGTFTGPRLNGALLPGGGDWLLFGADGVGRMDVRGTIRTDDGHLIYTHYGGVIDIPSAVRERMARGEPVDPSEYYWRATPTFETSSEKYAWLNRIVAVGVGRRPSGGVVAYTIYRIL